MVLVCLVFITRKVSSQFNVKFVLVRLLWCRLPLNERNAIFERICEGKKKKEKQQQHLNRIKGCPLVYQRGHREGFDTMKFKGIVLRCSV